MDVLNSYKELNNKAPLCIALGTFDGVHMGHQKLIDVLKLNSSLFDLKSMVYTFSKHPRLITMPHKSTYSITDNTKRADIFNKLGIDYLYLEDFKTIMHIDAEQFIKAILVERFNVKCVVVGYNYRFGFNGRGTAEDLQNYGKLYNFKTEIVPAVEINGQVVSSSLIRNTISSGEVHNVPMYLGRSYSISGDVVYGKQNGTKMGIRTANIEVDSKVIIPSAGVYATETIIEGNIYKSITNIGYNPTFEGSKLTIETHIIGFDEDLYNSNIEIYFILKLRNEIKFSSIDSLISQIKADIDKRLSLQ